MPYRLKRKESVADGIRRVADEQFAGAEKDLRAFRNLEVVHSARKRLKMLRAVLRLVRPAIDGTAFHRENLALRDIGRSLSVQRDADVFVEVMRALKPVRTSDRGYRVVMSHVRAHQEKVGRELRKSHAIAEARRGILEAHDRLKKWATNDISHKAVV